MLNRALFITLTTSGLIVALGLAIYGNNLPTYSLLSDPVIPDYIRQAKVGRSSRAVTLERLISWNYIVPLGVITACLLAGKYFDSRKK